MANLRAPQNRSPGDRFEIALSQESFAGVKTLEQLADRLRDVARFQMDQAGVGALRTHHRKHCLRTRRVDEKRSLVALDGNLAERGHAHAVGDTAAES